MTLPRAICSECGTERAVKQSGRFAPHNRRKAPPPGASWPCPGKPVSASISVLPGEQK